MTSKSERAKARILDAARSEFAQRGYQAATVRSIAREAQIDPAMVIRYFTTKALLFDAVCEIDLELPDVSAIPRSRVGSTLVRHFLSRWEGDPRDDSLLTLLRSAGVDESALRRLGEIFARQVRPGLADAVDDPAEVDTRVALVSAQLIGLAFTRHILRLPPVVALTHDEIVANLGPVVQRYLRGPLPRIA